jgi:hypothetical protein
MTQRAAIAMHLLKGETLTIMEGYKLFACSNLPRELSRSIEQVFKVKLSKERMPFKSRYGHNGVYFRYRLNKTPYNELGINAMRAYVAEQMPQCVELQQQKLF